MSLSCGRSAPHRKAGPNRLVTPARLAMRLVEAPGAGLASSTSGSNSRESGSQHIYFTGVASAQVVEAAAVVSSGEDRRRAVHFACPASSVVDLINCPPFEL